MGGPQPVQHKAIYAATQYIAMRTLSGVTANHSSFLPPPALAGAAAPQRLGVLPGRAHRLEAAVAELGRALALDPGLRDAALHRATALMDLGRFADALAGLERLAAQDPSDRRVEHLLAVCRRRAGAAP